MRDKIIEVLTYYNLPENGFYVDVIADKILEVTEDCQSCESARIGYTKADSVEICPKCEGKKWIEYDDGGQAICGHCKGKGFVINAV